MESTHLSAEEQIRQLQERIQILELQLKEKDESLRNLQLHGKTCVLTEESNSDATNVEFLPTTSSKSKRCSSLEDSVAVKKVKPLKVFNEYDSAYQEQRQQLTTSHKCSTGNQFSVQELSTTAKIDFPTYEKRKGIVDQGKEFECLMCAFYCLKFSTSDEVIDFKMSTNNNKCGDFDDIVLDVTFTNKKCTFLFQLKHQENEEMIIPRTLLDEFTFRYNKRERNKFYLPTYISSVSTLKNNIKDGIFILYTNRPSGITNGVKLVLPFTPVSVNVCNDFEYKELLLNTDKSSSVCQFLPSKKQFEEIYKSFYLFTNQNNAATTKSNVESILKSLLQCDIFNTFEHFIKTWWSRNFILTKHDVLAKLTELAFSPYIKIVTGTIHNEKFECLAQAIMKFEMTLCENFEDNSVADSWMVEKEKSEMEKAALKFGLTVMEPSDVQRTKILWYLEAVPLIIKVNDTNIIVVKSVTNLLRRNIGNKRIIILGAVTTNDFPDWKVFENFADIKRHNDTNELFDIIGNNFQLSLQGRQCISLHQLIDIDEEIASHIKTIHLLKMSQNTCLIGKTKESLPEIYIPRRIATTVVETEKLLKDYINRFTIVFNYHHSFEDKLRSKQINWVELPKYVNTDNVQKYKNYVIVSFEKCSKTQFEEVCKKSEEYNVCLFQVFDEHHCFLLLNKGSTSILKNIVNTEKTFEEDQIMKHFNSSLNTFCAPPGMGKSILLQAMSNKYCPSNMWTIAINLISHNPFFRRKPTKQTLVNHFLKNSDPLIETLQLIFYRRRKIIFFLDGLDEVDSASLDLIIDFVKYVAKYEIWIWLSSRENLRQKIIQSFNTIPIEIEKLDKQQQQRYIQQKLQYHYDEGKIEKIVKVVFDSTDVANSQELLGIPLQLHIITEMFLNDPDAYEKINEENLFVLTKMYQIYFEGKKNFRLGKLGLQLQDEQLGDFFKERLNQYEVLGLKTSLDDGDFRKFNLDVNQKKDFVDQIKKTGDKYGIIKSVSEDNQIVFNHQTYAEYFACVWLKKHLEKVYLLRHELLYERYENLKLMFDIMLAEENPLHLAILYKNIQQFKKHICIAGKKGHGGRTAIHIACSYGMQYPLNTDIEDHNTNLMFFVRRTYRGPRYNKHLNRESSTYMQIINMLMEEDLNVLECDELFRFNCLEYSARAHCLYPVEKMLETKKIQFEHIKKTLFPIHFSESLAYYSAQQGYPNLLLAAVSQDSSIDVNDNKFGDFGLLGVAVVGSKNDTYDIPRKGNIAAVDVLISTGANVNSVIKNFETTQSLLDYAYEMKCFDMINVLINHGALSGATATIDKSPTASNLLNLF